jgi:phosphoribosylformylglycinamidine synthase PurS subunit
LKEKLMYKIGVQVMPHSSLLDPQGKAVTGGMHNLGLTSVMDVRVGKYIELTVDVSSELEARELGNEAGNKLLANAIMERFEVVRVERI